MEVRTKVGNSQVPKAGTRSQVIILESRTGVSVEIEVRVRSVVLIKGHI